MGDAGQGATLVRPVTILCALIVVVVADGFNQLLAGFAPYPVWLVALLDEPAHLATGWLVLAAMAPPRRPLWFGTLAASVMLDLDHLPRILGWSRLTPTPSDAWPLHTAFAASAVVLLLALASGLSTRWLHVAAGISIGVLAHLGRDFATGGVHLLWPVVTTTVHVPYAMYAAALGAFAVLGWTRHLRPLTPRSTHGRTRAAGAWRITLVAGWLATAGGTLALWRAAMLRLGDGDSGSAKLLEVAGAVGIGAAFALIPIWAPWRRGARAALRAR